MTRPVLLTKTLKLCPAPTLSQQKRIISVNEKCISDESVVAIIYIDIDRHLLGNVFVQQRDHALRVVFPRRLLPVTQLPVFVLAPSVNRVICDQAP